MGDDASLEADRAAIRAKSTELLTAVNAADVESISAAWAEDGVMMPPHHPSVRGVNEIAAYFARLFATSRFAFEFTSSEVDLAGDLAFERVTYTASVTLSGGSTASDVGKGLHPASARRKLRRCSLLPNGRLGNDQRRRI